MTKDSNVNPHPDEALCDAVWSALKGDHSDLRKQSIILQAHREAIAPYVEALEWFAKRKDSILSDVRSGHVSRRDAASEWMREDDRDFLADLRKHFATIDNLLESKQ